MSFLKSAPKPPRRSVQTTDGRRAASPAADLPFRLRPKFRRATSGHPRGGSPRTSARRGFTISLHDFFLWFRTHLHGSSSDCSAGVTREGAKRKNPPPGSLRGWVRNFSRWLAVSPVARSALSGRSALRSRLNRRLRGSPDSLRCASQHILQDITSHANWESKLKIRARPVGKTKSASIAKRFRIPIPILQSGA